MNPAIQRFQALSGIGQARDIVQAFNACRESFNERFDYTDLHHLRMMWLASEWDYSPDNWTDWQVSDALDGFPPKWDDSEKPVRRTGSEEIVDERSPQDVYEGTE